MAIVDHLARALSSTMAVLGDMVQLDIESNMALNALESVAYELGQMSREERQEFVDVIQRIADTGDPEQADFIRSIPHSLGLDRDLR